MISNQNRNGSKLIHFSDKFIQKLSTIATSFGDPEPPKSLTENVSDKTSRNSTENVSEKTSRLPIDVALSSLNLVRDIHLDLLNVESLSALVSVRASLKIYIGLDQVRLIILSLKIRFNVRSSSFYCSRTWLQFD